jgi:hypothetical protein
MPETAQLVFILQARQPLTADPRAALPRPDLRVVLLAEDGSASPVREDVADLDLEIHRVSMDRWADTIIEISHEQPFDIITNDEYCLLTAEALRATFALPPRHPRTLSRYLDKVTMKEALAEHGVSTARFAALDVVTPDPDLARRLLEELGSPLVAKPRQEANSRGVQVLHTLGDLVDWQRRHAGARGWHLEEYLAGTQYHVNGLVRDGTVAPVQVGRYLGPLLGLPDGRRLGGVILAEDDELVAAAYALNDDVVAALGDRGAFVVHTEFVRRPDGCLTVMEVAARAPGAMVSEAARHHAGVNLEIAHLSLQLGAPTPIAHHTGIQAGWVWTPVMPGETFSGEPVFESPAEIHVRTVAKAGNQGSSGMIGASVLCWNSDQAQLDRDVQLALSWDWTRLPDGKTDADTQPSR